MNPMHRISIAARAAALLLTLGLGAPLAADEILDEHQQRAEDMLRELVGFESTIEHRDQTRAAMQAVIDRLLAAGFSDADITLVEPHPGSYGLVVRYRGFGPERPLLTMAHIDVVTADPDAWAFPPFTFGKKDGFYFGRGTQDNKTGVVQIAANFIRLKQEGYSPNRDLIMMVTGDEETEQKVADWLTTEGKDLIDAEFALNADGGGGELDEDGQPRSFLVQTSEKRYHTYRLSATSAGGHSSIPRSDNAINHLAEALVRIAANSFPVELNEGSRLYLERSAQFQQGQRAEDMRVVAESQDPAAAARLSGDPWLNATLRTTCVATEIKGGHAENALPRNASALVNCRILPGVAPELIEAQLKSWVDDDSIRFESMYVSKASPPSALTPALLEGLEGLVEETWPGIPLIPEMSTGATDGLFVRNAGIPTYGVAAWLMKPGDIRAHGLDEKVSIQRFHEGVEFWYRMLKLFSR